MPYRAGSRGISSYPKILEHVVEFTQIELSRTESLFDIGVAVLQVAVSLVYVPACGSDELVILEQVSF
jgi:hypothetical protein